MEKKKKFTIDDLKKAFDAGGDWRIACEKLTKGKIDKIEWSEKNYDFNEWFKKEYNNEDI